MDTQVSKASNGRSLNPGLGDFDDLIEEQQGEGSKNGTAAAAPSTSNAAFKASRAFSTSGGVGGSGLKAAVTDGRALSSAGVGVTQKKGSAAVTLPNRSQGGSVGVGVSGSGAKASHMQSKQQQGMGGAAVLKAQGGAAVLNRPQESVGAGGSTSLHNKPRQGARLPAALAADHLQRKKSRREGGTVPPSAQQQRQQQAGN